MKKNHEIVKRIGLANRKQEAEIFEKKKKKKEKHIGKQSRDAYVNGCIDELTPFRFGGVDNFFVSLHDERELASSALE